MYPALYFFWIIDGINLYLRIFFSFYKISVEVNGIDFQTFKDGIFQISVQSDELARRIFFKIDRSCEGVLDWGEF